MSTEQQDKPLGVLHKGEFRTTWPSGHESYIYWTHDQTTKMGELITIWERRYPPEGSADRCKNDVVSMPLSRLREIIAQIDAKKDVT